jgi:hypothetical protein
LRFFSSHRSTAGIGAVEHQKNQTAALNMNSIHRQLEVQKDIPWGNWRDPNINN